MVESWPIVELLVTHGADLTIGDRTPLYEACQEGHVDVVEFILQRLRSSYSLAQFQMDMNEALLCAAGIDSTELCSLLIESGAQIDFFSKDNRTPLMEACRQNSLKVVELLIKKGADVNKIAPSAGKEVDNSNGIGTSGSGTKKKGSKKLTQKDCCPTLKCPCCIPPSLQKSAKEVCTAAGIPPAPYSTSSTTSAMANGTFGAVPRRPPGPSRSATPTAHKTGGKAGTKSGSSTGGQAANNQANSLSQSSSNATLSDPSAWMDNSVTSCETQNNDTALTLACVGGHTSLVQLLIKKGAHLEHRDKKGFTPLILAATGGHVEICRLLIEASAQVDAQADRTKDTALSMACSSGRKEVVDLLLKHGANKEHRNLSDYTPLSLAASGGYVEIIQILLKKGAEINSRTNSKLGISPLMLAAMNGHKEATQVLLENGSDINAQIETNKNTALTLACFQGRAEVVRLLVDYGSNVEHRAKTGLTPLMEAANGGYLQVGRVLLVDADADVNASPVPTSRDTALTIAADKGHHAFVDLLLGYHAQINARNKKGCTALWLACNGGHLETVKVLVENRADTEAQDNRKFTPLMVAFRRGHHKTVKYLVEHVQQFPSDTECQRYILTQTDEDLVSKCSQCVKYIKEAKEKQTEQANKAADSLLAMLAREEAVEESRKRTKQRQKEKKKAKKQAKRAEDDVGEQEDNGMAQEEEAEELEQVEERRKLKVEEEAVQEVPKGGQKPREQQQPQRGVQAVQAVAERVEVAEVPKVPAEVRAETAKKPKSGAKGNQAKREKQQQRHKQQQNGGANENGNKMGAMVTMPSPLKATTTEEEAEWLQPSKKRATVAKSTESTKQCTQPQAQQPKPGSTTATLALAQSASQSAVIPPLFPEEDAMAVGSEPSGRRQSLKVLNIAAHEIPRVIGRAGCNVNAIREATGANVEVEKQLLDKEQTYRKITIKGTQEAVRNAVKMIDMLTRDHNLVIGEIMDLVMALTEGSNSTTTTTTDTNRKSPCSSTSSETTAQNVQAVQQRPSLTKTPPSVAPSPPLNASAGSAGRVQLEGELRKLSLQNNKKLVPMPQTAVPQQQPKAAVPQQPKAAVKQQQQQKNQKQQQKQQSEETTATEGDGTATAAVPNVWHKRAEAIRERKSTKMNLAIGESPFSSPQNRLSTASPPTGKAELLPVGPAAPLTAPPSLAGQPKQQLPPSFGVDPELAILLKEEHQRKAPGYARPQQSSSAQPMAMVQQQQLQQGQLEPPAAPIPSLFDSLSSRWSSNPLGLMVEGDMEEGIHADDVGTIQNCWSYLLEDRKSNTAAQQQVQAVQRQVQAVQQQVQAVQQQNTPQQPTPSSWKSGVPTAAAIARLKMDHSAAASQQWQQQQHGGSGWMTSTTSPPKFVTPTIVPAGIGNIVGQQQQMRANANMVNPLQQHYQMMAQHHFPGLGQQQHEGNNSFQASTQKSGQKLLGATATMPPIVHLNPTSLHLPQHHQHQSPTNNAYQMSGASASSASSSLNNFGYQQQQLLQQQQQHHFPYTAENHNHGGAPAASANPSNPSSSSRFTQPDFYLHHRPI